MTSRVSRSRRRFIELVGAGAIGTSAGLPLFFGRSVQGQPAKFPKRLITLVSYNGTVPAAWLPVQTEPELVLGPIHEPLEPHKKDLLLINGLRNRAGSDSPYAGCGSHCSWGNLLTGRPALAATTAIKHGGISLDQVVAQAIGQNSRFRSVEAKLRPSDHMASVSAAGPNLGKEANGDPYATFNRLFADSKLLPAQIERQRLVRKSVLDRGGSQTETLVARALGADAKHKLGAYHQALREVESSLDVSTGSTCEAPMLGTKLDYNASKNIPTMAKAHIDMLVASLTCDQTRVYTLELFDSGHGPVKMSEFIPEFPAGATGVDGHAIAHNSNTPTSKYGPHKIAFERWQASQLSYLLTRLKSVREGDGTLFDNSLVVHIQAMARGDHSQNPLPAVLSGRAAGWKMGRFLRFGPTEPGSSSTFATNLNDLWISVGQAMGLDMKTFGEPSYCKGPLPGMFG